MASQYRLLADLPNELVDSILSCLAIRDLVRASGVCQSWHISASSIYRARIAAAFHEDAAFRYVFEASQPAENNVQGCILRLQNKPISQPQHELAVLPDHAAFEFSDYGRQSTNIYKFKLEPDTFIQLCVLGNIIQPRKGGGLEGVAQHLDDFYRIKPENIDISIGSIRTFKINEHCHLTVRLLTREAQSGEHDNEEGPVQYEIEYMTLSIRSAHLLNALETYIASSLSSTALVLRTWA